MSRKPVIVSGRKRKIAEARQQLTAKGASLYTDEVPRPEMTIKRTGFLFSEGACTIDTTIDFYPDGSWNALVRLRVEPANARHRFLDTRTVRGDAKGGPANEQLLELALKMCVGRIGNFGEQQVIERTRQEVREELIERGETHAARSMGL